MCAYVCLKSISWLLSQAVLIYGKKNKKPNKNKHLVKLLGAIPLLNFNNLTFEGKT